MFRLKEYILISLVIFPLQILSQEQTCCASEKEVENALSGYWKIKNEDSKSLYHYWFKNDRGNVENVEITETIGKYKTVEKSHSFIYIKKENNSFILEYIYRYGNWTSTIKRLDENNLVLETNGEITEYYKVKY